MATIAQLETALRNADRAGDTEAAQRLAGALRQAYARRDRPPSGGGVAYRSSPITSVAQGLPYIGPITDELVALTTAGPGALQTGDSFLDAYSGILDRVRGNTQRYRAENPLGSFGIELGTSMLVPGGGPSNQAIRGASRAQNVARSMGTNVGLGAASGLAASDRATFGDAVRDSLLGAAFGTAGGILDLPRALSAPIRNAVDDAVRGGARTAGAEGAERARSVVRAADNRGFPLTPGEVRARDTGFQDLSGMAEETAARRGLLGRDAEQGMAAAEAARDRYVLSQLIDNRVLPQSVGEASDDVQTAILAAVDNLSDQRNRAYAALREFQPFVERGDLTDVMRATRAQLLDPPESAGWSSSLSPEAIRRMPYVRDAIEFLDDKIARIEPVPTGALAGPGGPERFGLGEIEDARRLLQGLARRAGGGADPDPNQARIISAAVRRLDDAESALFDGGLVRSSAGEVADFQAARSAARSANRRYMDAIAGRDRAGRRDRARAVTKLVEDLQAGNSTATTAVDRLVTASGGVRNGAQELLAQVDALAPQSGGMLRMAAARRLFGDALEVAEDGALRITDRRALLGRLERNLNRDAGFYDDIMGQGWSERARRLLEESRPSRVDTGRAGNRFDPMNPSGSGSMAALYRHMYTGLQALARRMQGSGVLSLPGAALNATAQGMRSAAEAAAGNRVVRGVLDAVEPQPQVLPEEFVTQWRALVPGTLSTSLSSSGGQAIAADREPSLL